MSKELIARLREGQKYDFESGYAITMDYVMDEAADALEAAQAEIERKNALLRSFVAVLKADRHDWEDWPTDSRDVVAAITKEIT